MSTHNQFNINTSASVYSRDSDDLYNYIKVEEPASNLLESDDSLMSITSMNSAVSETEDDPQSPNSPAYKRYRMAAGTFMIISIVSAILIIILQAYMYAVINIHKHSLDSESKYQEISIFLALFIFAAIFQVVITAIGLRTKNILLLLVLCIFYGCMLIYTGIQYEEIRDLVGMVLQGDWRTATRATNIATICIIAFTLLSQLLILIFYLRQNVTWFKFKTIGADIRIKRLHRVFQIHRLLLMFSFFFFLGFTIQFIIIMINDKSSVEFILTVLVLPLTIGVLLLSDLAVSKELLWLTIPCLMVYLGGIAYVLFKMIRLYTKYTSAYDLSLQPGDYFPGRKSLLTFGIITLIILTSVVILEVILMINFRKGLKDVVNKQEDKQEIDID